MIEYLRQLIKDEKWETALAYAQQLTAGAEMTPRDLVVIHNATLRARIAMGEHAGAVPVGELAVKLAREVGDWDAYGQACNDLGVSHFMLKEYDEAISCFNEFLKNTDKFTEALQLHTLVWYNLSCAYRAEGNGRAAVHALTRAVEQARRDGDTNWVQGSTLALINARLRAGQTEQVPKLLAQSSYQLRNFAGKQERLLHLRAYRAEFALLTGRLARARAHAVKGLMEARDLPRHLFEFHMLLAQVERQGTSKDTALDHALAARAYAVASQRPDLEAKASGLIDDLMGCAK